MNGGKVFEVICSLLQMVLSSKTRFDLIIGEEHGKEIYP